MDVPILLANLALLERLRPVLFFEYDPHLGAAPDVLGLSEKGYAAGHWYENTGEHSATRRAPCGAAQRVHGHGGARYADVCVRPR